MPKTKTFEERLRAKAERLGYRLLIPPAELRETFERFERLGVPAIACSISARDDASSTSSMFTTLDAADAWLGGALPAEEYLAELRVREQERLSREEAIANSPNVAKLETERGTVLEEIEHELDLLPLHRWFA